MEEGIKTFKFVSHKNPIKLIIYFALQILFVIGNKPAKKSKFYLQKFMKIFAVFARNKKKFV